MKGSRASPAARPGPAPARGPGTVGTPSCHPRHTLWGDSRANPACAVPGSPGAQSRALQPPPGVCRDLRLSLAPAVARDKGSATPEPTLCQARAPSSGCPRVWNGPSATGTPSMAGRVQGHPWVTLSAPQGFTHLRGRCQDVPGVMPIHPPSAATGSTSSTSRCSGRGTANISSGRRSSTPSTSWWISTG